MPTTDMAPATARARARVRPPKTEHGPQRGWRGSSGPRGLGHEVTGGRADVHESVYVLRRRTAEVGATRAGSGSAAAEGAPAAGAEKISKDLVATGAQLQRENCEGTECSRDILKRLFLPEAPPQLRRRIRHILSRKTGKGLVAWKTTCGEAGQWSLCAEAAAPQSQLQ